MFTVLQHPMTASALLAVAMAVVGCAVAGIL